VRGGNARLAGALVAASRAELATGARVAAVRAQTPAAGGAPPTYTLGLEGGGADGGAAPCRVLGLN
jgi:hypothetical protein